MGMILCEKEVKVDKSFRQWVLRQIYATRDRSIVCRLHDMKICLQLHIIYLPFTHFVKCENWKVQLKSCQQCDIDVM